MGPWDTLPSLTNLAVLPFSSPRFRWSHPSEIELPLGIREKFNRVSLGTSFRGGPYEGIITALTGYSLYDEYLSPNQVKDIHTDLWDYLKDPPLDCGEMKFIEQLEGFFRVCVKNNLGLVALVEEM